jgi:DNA-binding response OmpR family regulator
MSTDRILVVDDDPDILRIVKDSLELDGLVVHTVTTGKEAMAWFEEHGASLVVLDLSLPDMDGIQVCRLLRASSDVPIVMLTARDRVPDKVLGLESGADDYLSKPFDCLELTARIRACLRRSRQTSREPEEIIHCDLRIDLSGNTVWKRSKEIALTQREFALLVFLARNAGKVMKRLVIRQTLWPSGDLYRDSRTIDVHIQHLRGKLEDVPAEPRYIITVPGVGYMMPEAQGGKTSMDA